MCDSGGHLHFAEADAFAESVDEFHFFFGDAFVAHDDVDHVLQQAVAHAGVDVEDVAHGLVECFADVTARHFFQIGSREDLETGQGVDDLVEFVFVHFVVGQGHDNSGRGDEASQGFVEFGVAHF